MLINHSSVRSKSNVMAEKVYWGGGIGMENLDVHYGSSPSIASQQGKPSQFLSQYPKIRLIVTQ